jgi:hypothetical protein
LTEQIDFNKILMNDFNSSKNMIQERDNELKRLNALYENNVNTDTLVSKYQVDKYKRTIENLNRQLEYINNENNTLCSSKFDNKSLKETLDKNNIDLLRSTTQINQFKSKNEMLISEINKKDEIIKRLSDQ